MKKVNCAEEYGAWRQIPTNNPVYAMSPCYRARVMCVPATALSLPNGSSIHFTDECTMKWREQWYNVVHSIAGVTAVFTEARRTVSRREERRQMHMLELLCDGGVVFQQSCVEDVLFKSTRSTSTSKCQKTKKPNEPTQ